MWFRIRFLNYTVLYIFKDYLTIALERTSIMLTRFRQVLSPRLKIFTSWFDFMVIGSCTSSWIVKGFRQSAQLCEKPKQAAHTASRTLGSGKCACVLWLLIRTYVCVCVCYRWARHGAKTYIKKVQSGEFCSASHEQTCVHVGGLVRQMNQYSGYSKVFLFASWKKSQEKCCIIGANTLSC